MIHDGHGFAIRPQGKQLHSSSLSVLDYNRLGVPTNRYKAKFQSWSFCDQSTYCILLFGDTLSSKFNQVHQATSNAVQQPCIKP